MKQKIKQTIVGLLSIIFFTLPLVSFAAATLDDANRGLVVCGNGTGSQSEEAAIQNLLKGDNRPPNSADSIYQKPDGTFDAVKYDAAYKAYLERTANKTISQQQGPARQANWARYFENSCQFIDIFRQIVKLINYLMAAAGIFFTFKMVLAGMQLVLNAANADANKEAKKALINALIGFAIVLASFAVVNVIFEILAIQLNTDFPLNPFK